MPDRRPTHALVACALVSLAGACAPAARPGPVTATIPAPTVSTVAPSPAQAAASDAAAPRPPTDRAAEDVSTTIRNRCAAIGQRFLAGREVDGVAAAHGCVAAYREALGDGAQSSDEARAFVELAEGLDHALETGDVLDWHRAIADARLDPTSATKLQLLTFLGRKLEREIRARPAGSELDHLAVLLARVIRVCPMAANTGIPLLRARSPRALRELAR